MCWTYTGLLSGCFHVLVILQGLISAFVYVLDLYQESFLDLFCVEFIQGLFSEYFLYVGFTKRLSSGFVVLDMRI